MKTYAVDIDGTLCSDTEGNYEYCVPNFGIIRRVRELYAAGHRIVIHTARSEQRRQLTITQLANWRVLYHELVMGKPKADHYVDDKSMKPEGLLYESSTGSRP